MMIGAIRATGVTATDGRRDVVIHSQFMRPDQLDVYVELGLSPSFFTAHTFFCVDIHVENTGPERVGFTSPMASALARGLRRSNHFAPEHLAEVQSVVERHAPGRRS